MRKVIVDLAISLDGFIEGNNGETDWCIMDDEMDFEGFLSTVDMIFYGRVSYDAWGNYQPVNRASDSEMRLWHSVHSKEKYVFSKQVRQYEGATVIASDIKSKVTELKMQAGKNIWLYGGASLIDSFIHMDLIDIYRLSIHPIALGKGKALFENIRHPQNLKLTGSKVFKSGVVQVIYVPQKERE